MQPNRADYLKAVSLEDAKWRLQLSYGQGLKLGYPMSPVWVEAWEATVFCASLNVVAVEMHSACPSNGGLSEIQVILPSPRHVLGLDDKVTLPN